MTASRRVRRLRLLAALGALAAMAVVTVGPATAGTGLGAIFNLGKTNTVNTVSTLKGATTTRLLQVTQTGNGAGIQITTKLTAPPLKVNSSVRVDNLNADKLDGLHAADFMAAGAHPDADTLDGLDSTAFMAAGAHPDAASLGGLAPGSYLKVNPITQVYGPSSWHRNGLGTFGTVSYYTDQLQILGGAAGAVSLQLDLPAPVSEFGYRYALGSVTICMVANTTAHVNTMWAQVFPAGGGAMIASKQDSTSHSSSGCTTLSIDVPTEGGHAGAFMTVTFDAAATFGLYNATAMWVPMGPTPVILGLLSGAGHTTPVTPVVGDPNAGMAPPIK